MASKNFLDETGLSYFWFKVTSKINSITPADIGAQPKIIATGILYSDGTGAVTAKETVSASVLEAEANKWLGTNADGAVVAKNLPNAGTGSRGITYLVDSYARTDTDKAVTPKALNAVYKLIPTIEIAAETTIAAIINETYTDDDMATDM